ncbi:MAG: 2-oxoacid:ferredoxin oxidoreductase subunit gamma, partial [Eubacteriaceae bacterium]|nr:2-oxoacid:ferredoxin oxidoreductase subunit gamma [Eubacteriaceae bacterium]
LVLSRPEKGGKYYEVDSSAIANEVGSPKVANMVILGAYVAINGNLDVNEVKHMVEKSLGSKKDLIELNMKAIDAGIAAIKK